MASGSNAEVYVCQLLGFEHDSGQPACLGEEVRRFLWGGKSDESLDFSVIEWSRICWPHRGDLTWYPTVGDYAESLPHQTLG